MKEYKINFTEHGKEIFALPGTSLFECVTRAGILIKTPCAGAGTCGKCVIQITDGTIEASEECKKRFSKEELECGFRLACRASLESDITVKIPYTSLFESGVVTLGDNDHSGNLRNTQIGKHSKSAKFAVAIDLGTTTVALALLDLATGRQIGSAGILNPQTRFGADVLNRICAQGESNKNLEAMSSCIIDACNQMIDNLCKKQGIAAEKISVLTIAGNTVMQHIICKIPAKQLGEIPFEPVVSETMFLTTENLPFRISNNAEIIIFPVIGGFVGGDITAGLIAAEFADKNDEISLFVDVGTNGEIVLKNGDKMYATAAAAGPAFEGAGIESGMRAADGAIEKIIIENGKLLFNVIGNCEPHGICGTALIDLIAEMLRSNLLDETGRILSADESECTSNELTGRLTVDPETDTVDFLIYKDAHRSIFLRQKDVRQFQLASGAIRAATNILLKNAGVQIDDIEMIYIAGGFGNYIRRSNAKCVGMIPDVVDNKIHFIGNTSLIGAKLAAIDKNQLDKAAKLAKAVECIDVSLDIEFQMEFASAMIFPNAP